MSNTNLIHLVLGIESSCDETSLCLLAVPDFINKPDEDNVDLKLIRNTVILSSIISSQIKTHQKYGGVVPEIGARLHAEQIHFIWKELLEQVDQAKFDLIFDQKPQIKNQELELQDKVLLLLEKIMVTTNPGLISALRVGQEFAKTIKFFCEIQRVKHNQNTSPEIMEINHLRGHLASSFYQYS
jgi:N6-L-threonylcarbamoyladenine synthase